MTTQDLSTTGLESRLPASSTKVRSTTSSIVFTLLSEDFRNIQVVG